VVTKEFLISDAVLLSVQAALVALPDRGVPKPLERFRTPAWALILPLSIAVVVAAIALFPEVARALSWLALLAIPPLAAAALGWAMHGARPWLALLAIPLLAIGWSNQFSLSGELCLTALTALSCVTLGRLLAGLVPLVWLELGIVAMAVVDAILVFGNQLQGPNEVLNTAVPAAGLPQLQYLQMPHASLGYGDVFVAGVLGGVLAQRRQRQWTAALLVLALSAAWDVLFRWFDTLPATVPVAVALIILRVTGGRAARPSARVRGVRPRLRMRRPRRAFRWRAARP
jgi:hypothetical protein